MRPHARRPSVLLSWFCVAFIVYGSLYPFDFRAAPLPFTEILVDWNPFHDRSDAVDNILLFIPLGVALDLALKSSRWRLPAAAIAWLVLGVGLQVAQLWVASRVASMSDAINNAIGLALGMALAGRVSTWLESRRRTGHDTDRFALLLVAAWYVYESFPFMPTLDVGLLAGHVRQVLNPPPFEMLRLFRHALAATIGASALLAARPLQSRRLSLGIAAALLFGSEILVLYGDLRIEALLGIGLGIGIAALCERQLGRRNRQVVLLVSAVALLMTVITPFRGESTFGTFTLTPFGAVLWQGVTQGIPTAGFEALAIGGLMWSAVELGPASWGLRRWALPTLALVAGLELLRRVTGSGPGDTGNLVLAALMLPFAVAWRSGEDAPVETFAPIESKPTRRMTATTDAPPTYRKRILVQALAFVVVLAIGMAIVLRLPGVPYNVRELFDSRSVWNLALFSLALLWLGAGPAWMVRVAARSRLGVAWLPVLAVAASMFSLLLLRLSVTQESLDDITGSTDLYRRIVQDNLWGTAWRQRVMGLPSSLVGALERGVRYGALYGILLLPLAAALLCTVRSLSFGRKMAGVVLLAACWWLARLVVVDDAITDNLTELIAKHGEPWLAAVLVMLAVHVVVASGRITLVRLVAMAGTTVVAVPLGFWLLKHGLEPMLIKYGQIFSALQFLLGRNRTALLTEHQLFLRWTLLYLATLVVLAVGMSMVRRWGVAPKAAR